jgi:hypothetical protein
VEVLTAEAVGVALALAEVEPEVLGGDDALLPPAAEVDDWAALALDDDPADPPDARLAAFNVPH